ncbi:efflux RND transporter periplasmic adaptor subunit [Hydrogenovibrio kuenenii]|uniref:efflux RND transporter periplasmic adaptor subunit n=1 Tax=Hydrogenovibrio kuenenii TaxID=63658 RepID=UPI00046688DF|nr:HlyD family efflux transporter periplasmic adaptor subunit [Hydrogenovibrio kuenenii]
MKLPTIGASKSKNAFVAILIILLVVVIVAYMVSTKPKPPPVEIKQKVWPIEAMKVSVGQVVPKQSLYGTVESTSMVTAAAPVSGVVAAVSVKDGDEVQKGDKLVALSDADIQLPYQIAKADVEDTRAQLQLQALAYKSNQAKLDNERKVLAIREEDVKRNQELIKKDLASKSTLDIAKEARLKQKLSVVNANLSVEENKLKVAQLKARLAKAEANFQQAKINLKRGQLVAPYAIRVSKVSVSAGDRVSPGTALLSFYGLDSLELKATIPAAEVKDVYAAMQQGQSFTADYLSYGQRYELHLKRLAGEASTSGLNAYFSLPKTLKSVRPGDLLQVRLRREPIANGFAVPYSALYGSSRVYVVKDGLLERRKVKVLGETPVKGQTWVLLKGGVQSGEQVAITHLPNAVTGLKVSVMEP